MLSDSAIKNLLEEAYIYEMPEPPYVPGDGDKDHICSNGDQCDDLGMIWLQDLLLALAMQVIMNRLLTFLVMLEVVTS